MSGYRKLKADEIELLSGQGCSALDWKQVEVAEGFNALRVRNTHFIGAVKVGRLSPPVSLEGPGATVTVRV